MNFLLCAQQITFVNLIPSTNNFEHLIINKYVNLVGKHTKILQFVTHFL